MTSNANTTSNGDPDIPATREDCEEKQEEIEKLRRELEQKEMVHQEKIANLTHHIAESELKATNIVEKNASLERERESTEIAEKKPVPITSLPNPVPITSLRPITSLPTLFHVPLLALMLVVIWGVHTSAPLRVSFVFTLIAQAVFLYVWNMHVTLPIITAALLSMLVWIPYLAGV